MIFRFNIIFDVLLMSFDAVLPAADRSWPEGSQHQTMSYINIPVQL